DVVYPRANTALWQRVAEGGLLLSEAPPGARPERWRFPARNRLIAGLADLVVVVESHDVGGSLLTVGEAMDRGITVMAVPGAVTSPASTGTNQLLAEGCAPARTALDVLDALRADGLHVTPAATAASATVVSERSATTAAVADADELPPLCRQILADTSAGAVHIDHLVASCRVPIPELLAAIRYLEAAGLVVLDGSTVVRASREVMHRHTPG
ncbi:MAG: DNA-processing protein DprA, partial [Acidimicrobiia bacterium]|nr:DNA-processing protein DprA [Acidimicrobiia bacterium]